MCIFLWQKPLKSSKKPGSAVDTGPKNVIFEAPLFIYLFIPLPEE